MDSTAQSCLYIYSQISGIPPTPVCVTHGYKNILNPGDKKNITLKWRTDECIVCVCVFKFRVIVHSKMNETCVYCMCFAWRLANVLFWGDSWLQTISCSDCTYIRNYIARSLLLVYKVNHLLSTLTHVFCWTNDIVTGQNACALLYLMINCTPIVLVAFTFRRLSHWAHLLWFNISQHPSQR